MSPEFGRHHEGAARADSERESELSVVSPEFPPVTFDPRLFDEKPESVRLLSYGEELFESLVGVEPAVAEQTLPPWIIRLTSQDPLLCSYFRMTESGIEHIRSLSDVRAALEQKALGFDEERRAEATRTFEEEVESIREQQAAVERSRHQAEQAAIYERARLLLLRATYVDLAMSSLRGLFDHANLAGFTEEAVLNLRRHGYPFAPLIRMVGTEGIRPSPTDPDWTTLQDASLDNLRKRLEALKRQIEEVLGKIVQP